MTFLTDAFFPFFPMLEMIKKERSTPWRMVPISGPLNYNKYLKGDVSLSPCYCALDAFMEKKKKVLYRYSICCLEDLSPIFVISASWWSLFFEFYFKKSTFKHFFSPDSCSAIRMPLPGSHRLYPAAFILYIKRKVLKLRSQYQRIGPIFPSKYIACSSDLFLGILFLTLPVSW